MGGTDAAKVKKREISKAAVHCMEPPPCIVIYSLRFKAYSIAKHPSIRTLTARMMHSCSI